MDPHVQINETLSKLLNLLNFFLLWNRDDDNIYSEDEMPLYDYIYMNIYIITENSVLYSVNIE